MEGALPSLVTGLVSVPVVAVPTSVGYGAAFDGLAALLGMLNSCAVGMAVVNIDNGFGAASMAARILAGRGAAKAAEPAEERTAPTSPLLRRTSRRAPSRRRGIASTRGHAG